MIITNKLGLPEAFVNAVKRHVHAQGDISVTQLEKSPREYWLLKRHDTEISVDVSQMIWSIFGSAVHTILEKGADINTLTEELLSVKVSGRNLTGTADLYVNEKVSDYKTTSAYTVIYGSRIDEWTKQLNVYKYLYENTGFKVKELEIVALLKDWSTSKAKYDSRYPQTAVIKIPIPIWDTAKIEEYIKDRISVIYAHENTPDDQLPACTDAEMWRKEAVYKCIKPGQVKSKKNFSNKAEAEVYCQLNKLELKEYPGECVKCTGYCYAQAHCSQYMAGSEPPVLSEDI